jgi:hypothetical protein
MDITNKVLNVIQNIVQGHPLCSASLLCGAITLSVSAASIAVGVGCTRTN